MAEKIQIRRDSSGAWALANPTLADGEMGWERDTRQFKIGDGVTRWNDLSYGGLRGPAGDSSTTPTTTAPSTMSGHRVLARVAGVLVYASSANPAHAGKVVGISLNAALAGQDLSYQTSGEVTEPSWSLTPDMPVYLGVDGLFTQTPPTNPPSVFTQVIGFAAGPTTIFFNPQQPIFII